MPTPFGYCLYCSSSFKTSLLPRGTQSDILERGLLWTASSALLCLLCEHQPPVWRVLDRALTRAPIFEHTTLFPEDSPASVSQHHQTTDRTLEAINNNSLRRASDRERYNKWVSLLRMPHLDPNCLAQLSGNRPGLLTASDAQGRYIQVLMSSNLGRFRASSCLPTPRCVLQVSILLDHGSTRHGEPVPTTEETNHCHTPQPQQTTPAPLPFPPQCPPLFLFPSVLLPKPLRT